ncbi:MAG: TonB-dependent receptor [Methylotenera sp. 17-45-7]|jgi:outer membrane receptor protein involved in Fe transport|nr:MAG: TonB-dependent receptor [Methylotenera sp. 17-45-7]OZA53185.1 MAG: TonB-dependent receptor [Methylophilales bacterium 39-45-7]
MKKTNMKPAMKLSWVAVMLALGSATVSADETGIKLKKIEVYGTTPLPGLGLPLNRIPANIQIAAPKDINSQTGSSAADYMANNMQGVTVSDSSGNPWQPEINFRGYSASSLLGTPQGISTYVDGVRVNEPFGDVTLWDKIPSFAIENMQLVPGSNPLYGLNTLGGAISVQTKSGRNHQGAALEYEAGSWGRQRSLIEYGGVSKDGSVDYMLGYQHTTEDGWRDFSPSHVNQLFGKTGWQNESSKLDLTYIGTDNNLTGNGLTPQNLLSGDREQIHTRPDFTNNYSHFLALNGSHWVNEDTMFSGNVYYKKSNRVTKNGDLFESELGNGDTLDGYDTTLGNCTGADCQLVGSVTNRTKTSQDSYGATGQMSFNQDFMGKQNQFIIGLGYDYSLIRFKQSERINLADDGDIGDMSGGFTGSPVDQVFDATRQPIASGAGLLPQRQTTGLTGKQYTARLFATDTLSLNEKWHLNAGASWNFTRVDNVDTLRGDASDKTLTAKDSYTRLNPTVGLTHTPNDNLTLFTSYSEASRAPTSIELGCSNPLNPCLLPSALADDPPLNQVVAKTYELGGRGKINENIRWNVGAYHATNHDDIMFTAANAFNGAGYYKNVGRTKRQGLDLGLAGDIDKFRWSASYSYVRATYDTDVSFVSSSNSSEDADSVIFAKPGDRIPNIPAHQLKLRGQYAITPAWTVGTNIIGYSDAYATGNENNQHQSNNAACTADVTSCATGRGKVSGYFIMNLDTQYNFGNGWKAFAKATNIFDREYNLGGRLAETLFNSEGVFGTASESKTLSLLPGAPRAAWLGLRYEFAAPKPAASSN